MSNVVFVSGLDELILRLDELDDAFSGKGKLLEDALLQSAKVLETAALRFVPVRTGQLRDSIYSANSTSNLTGERQTHAKPGTAKVAASDYKAHLVEYGTRHTRAQSFLRRAKDERGEQAIREFSRVVESGLKL